MKRLVVGLYPRRWRDRYGDELGLLLDERQPTLGDLADLARGALAEHVRQVHDGGWSMKVEPAWRHPGRWSLAAALIILPTGLVASLSLLAHELGVPGLAGWVDPIVAELDEWPPLDLFLLLAPLVGTIVAAAPLVRVDLTAGEARIAIRARTANLVVTLVALALGAVLIGHIVSESLLHAGA